MRKRFLKYVAGCFGRFLGRRESLLRRLTQVYRTNYWYSAVGTIGSGVKFWGRIEITAPRNVEIGDDCTFNEGVIIVSRDRVRIGNRVRISPQAMIISGALDYGEADVAGRVHNAKSITIEDDVWIASGAKILQGVVIGRNSIVACGAVVTTDVPPYSIAKGIPAKIFPLDEKDTKKNH